MTNGKTVGTVKTVKTVKTLWPRAAAGRSQGAAFSLVGAPWGAGPRLGGISSASAKPEGAARVAGGRWR